MKQRKLLNDIFGVRKVLQTGHFIGGNKLAFNIYCPITKNKLFHASPLKIYLGVKRLLFMALLSLV